MPAVATSAPIDLRMETIRHLGALGPDGSGRHGIAFVIRIYQKTKLRNYTSAY